MPAKKMTSNRTHRGHGPLLPENKQGHSALRRGRTSIPHHVYLVTTATVQRRPFFLNFQAGCAAARCFEDKAILDDTKMVAWVLMPDHAHWLVQPGDRYTLTEIVNRLKSASARHANRVMEREGALWQKAFHDRALRAEEDLRQIARYIVTNPVRAGLVYQVQEYPFWNAMWL